MDVPQTRTEVTTSGFYREELDALKDALSRCDLAYSGDLTSRTRVLVVHDSCASKKFEVAREQQIPCVPSTWVYDGQCSVAQAEAFDVCHTLSRYTVDDANAELCTTGIDSTLRAMVREIATLRGVRFNSVLSRHSCLLVVPSLSSTDSKAPHNDKVAFAKRHGIPMLTLREFTLRYGQPGDTQHLLERRSQSRSLRSAPTSTYTRLTRSSLDITPSHTQLRADMSDVVVCALLPTIPQPSQPERITEARTLATLCGASWRETVSDDSTHLLVLVHPDDSTVADPAPSSSPLPGLTTSSVFPRRGLETIRVDWLRACLRDQRRHACVGFRVPLTYKPIITISGVTAEKRESFHYFLQHCGLSCEVQDRLVLHDIPQSTMTDLPASSATAPLTTHLIVPRPALTRSAEVDQLSRERHCGGGASQCILVDLEWLLRSIRARKWIDPTFFELTVPPPAVMEQERVKQRRTEGNSGAVLPRHARLEAVSEPEVTDAAPEAATHSGTVEEDEEEGASQTAHSQIAVAVAPAAAPPPASVSPTKSDDLPHSLTLEALLDALESHSLPFEFPTSPVASQVVAASQASYAERPTAQGGPSLSSPHTMAGSLGSWKARTTGSPPRRPATTASASSAEPCCYESQTVVYDHDNVSVAPRQFQPGGSSFVRPSITLTELAHLSASALPDFGDSSKDAPWALSQSTTSRFVLLLSKEVTKEMDCAAFQQQFPFVQCTQTVDECTHLVTNKPAKTEVFLCALACGKWIVSPAFLTDSMAAGRMTHEKGYEWNSKRAAAAGHRASVAELVQGCRMQRVATQRPFVAWHVLLSCSSSIRTVSFAHVLRCGGCVDVRAKGPEEILAALENTTSSELHDGTVVLADDDVWALPQLEQFTQTCQLSQKHVLRLDYLVHCLFTANPSPAQFELLRLVQTKKSTRRE